MNATVTMMAVMALTVCGCVRTMYVEKDYNNLRAVRMQRGGVDGMWVPDAYFRSIRANAELMLDLMRESELEASGR